MLKQSWLENFEEDNKDKETVSLVKDVFMAGKWNGGTYTVEDLDDMVKNFSKLKDKIRVPLKVDLFKNAKAPNERHGGQPAFGWVSELWREGKTLFAKFTDVPKLIKDLVDKKAYRNVSSEIMFNFSNGLEKFKKVLTGVALLGIERPGVGDLEEVWNFYEDNLEGYDIKSYEYKGNALENTIKEENVMELETMKKEFEAKLSENEVKIKDFQDKLAEVEKQKADFEAKAVELEASKKNFEAESFIKELEIDGKIVPAQKEVVFSLLKSASDSKEVKFQSDNGEVSKSQSELLKDFLKAMPKAIEFSEKIGEGKAPEEPVTKPKFDNDSDRLDFAAKEYMKDNKEVTYTDALIEVSKLDKEAN